MKYITRFLAKRRRDKVLAKTDSDLEDCARMIEYLQNSEVHSEYVPRIGMKYKLKVHSSTVFELARWFDLTNMHVCEKNSVTDVPTHDGWTYLELYRVNHKGEQLNLMEILPILMESFLEYKRLTDKMSKLHREYYHARTRLGIQDLTMLLRAVIQLMY